MKIKLEIAETVWSEVTIDNVENVEEAKQKFYDNYDKLEKYSQHKKYVCDDVDVYDWTIIQNGKTKTME
jgi:hypothetical protein